MKSKRSDIQPDAGKGENLAFVLSPANMNATILQTAMDAFWIMDTEGRLVDVNEAAVMMLGFSREEMLSRSISDFTPEVSREQVNERIQRILKSGHDRFQSKLRHKDGSIIDVEVNTTWQPAYQAFFAFLHDISIREKARLEVIRQNKRLESLVAILQHPAESVQEFLDYALNEVISLTDSEIGYIYFYDEDKEEFTLNTWSKTVLDACTVTNPGTVYQLEKTGIWGEAVRQRKAIIINDFHAVNPLKKGYPEGHVPLHRFLTVPVFHNKRIVAVVGVGNKKAEYDQTDILQLSLLMDAVWKTTEYRKSKEEILYEQEKAKNYLEIAEVIIVVINSEGNIELINRKGSDLLGCSEQELIGKNWFETFIPIDIRQDMYGFFRKILDGSAVSSEYHENPILTRSGDSRMIGWHNTILKDHTGKPIGTLSSGEDITDRKNAQHKIREAAENWNRTFDAMKDGIALLDINGTILQSNRSFREIFGNSGTSVQNNDDFGPLCALICPDENCLYTRMQKSKNRESAETMINGKAFKIIVDPIFGESGALNGAVYILADISGRKREETIQSIQYNIARAITKLGALHELLEIIRQELNRIIDTTNFFVAFCQPGNKTLKSPMWSDEHDVYNEWPVENSLSGIVVKTGKPLLLTWDQIIGLDSSRDLQLKGTIPKCWLGVPMISKNQVIGAFVLQSYSSENAYSTDDIGLMEIVANHMSVFIEKKRNEDEIIQAKNKAEESDRLKSAFLANMSHEIRTPLNGILGFMELLEDRELTEAEQSQYFSIIHKSSDRLLNTINNIIDISKIEAGQMPLQVTTYELTEQLNFLHGFFTPEARRKGLGLSLTIKPVGNGIPVSTDRQKLEAIYTNLIKNAIKYTDCGTIEIGCTVNRHLLRGFVRDTGIGIPPERLKRVFDRFIQVHDRVTRSYEGSGLGLTITKAYVEMLNGTISVSSTEGVGTMFEFSIPVGEE